MWTRQGEERPFLLTLGKNVHISNPRYNINFRYPNNWRLIITSVKRDDHGQYACQVNTHPPKTLITDVTVLGKFSFFKYYFYSQFMLTQINLSCFIKNSNNRQIIQNKFLLNMHDVFFSLPFFISH